MIAYIEGRVLFLGKGMLVIQTPSGIGYEVRVPEPISHKFELQQEISLYTHMHVREDDKAKKIFKYQ